MTAHFDPTRNQTALAPRGSTPAQTSLATAFDVVPPAIVKQLWLDTDSHYWSDDAPKMLARAKHDGTAEAIPGLAAETTAALAPIERKPLLDRLTLLGMSMANGKDAAQIEAWLHETARLLERFPAAVLLPALDECAMQYKFLPTVAEINDKAEPRFRTLQRRAARLNRLAQMIADGVPLPEYAPPPEDASKPLEKP